LRKIGRGVSPRETTRCGLSASRPWLRHPAPLFCRPVTAAPRRVPNGKNPALVGLRLRFACGETARAVIGPTGADVLAYPAFASLKRGPSANNPALVAVRLHFAARNRAYGYRPHRGRYFRTFARHDCKSAGFSL